MAKNLGRIACWRGRAVTVSLVSNVDGLKQETKSQKRSINYYKIVFPSIFNTPEGLLSLCYVLIIERGKGRARKTGTHV